MSKQEKSLKTIVKQQNFDTDFEYICQEVEKGSSLRSVCNSFMPTKKFYELLEGSEEKRKRYAHACEERADSIFEEIIDISNESNADLTISERGQLVVDGEAVSRSRLKIDARKWVLSKLSPKKYGDKIEVDNNVTLTNFSIKDIISFEE